MIIARIDDSQIARLKAAVADTGRTLRKELAIAANAAARKGKSVVNKQIRTELVIKAKDLRPVIRTGRKANTEDISTSVSVSKTKRISLREFGARQTRKGVSYRASKTGGRKIAKGAFQGPRPGLMKVSWRGHVFKRTGKSRLPIAKLHGPSAWGVFVVGKKMGTSAEVVQAELVKQVERRIRFVLLKKSGEI